MDVFDLFARISLDTGEYERGLSNAQSQFQTAGKTLASVGSTMTKKVSLPLVGIGTAIVKTGADYEAGMSKVQAISGATGKEMDALSDKAMEMASKTKFSTAESAEAYQYMAMAGWKSSQMVDGLSGIMNLAAASGESLATTSDIVTDALTAFGLSASDSGRFADVLAVASSNSNTNVAMMGETFKYVAPVAGAFGYSVEDTAVAIGLMANAGIKGSQAGTALRGTLTNLAKPSDQVAGYMKALDLSLTDAAGNVKPMNVLLLELREKFSGLTEAQKAEYAAGIAGKEAMSGLLAIVNASDADFAKLTQAIADSNGAAEEMATVMNDNAAGAVTMLMSAVNVLFTSLSQFLIPIFTDVVRAVTNAVNWFNSLDDNVKKLILTLGGIAIAVGPVLGTIGKIIKSVSTIRGAVTGVIGAVKSVGTAISGLFSLLAANPIALVIAAIAALVTAFVLLWNNCEEFREFWIGLWEKITEVARAVWEAITGFFTAAWDTIQSAWGTAGEFFSGVWEGIRSVFSAVAEFFEGVFAAAWEGIQAAWSGVAAFFLGVWTGIQEVFSAVAEFFGGVFYAAWDAVQVVWNMAQEFFFGVWTGIQDVFSAVVSFFEEIFSAAWKGIQGIWSGATAFFTGVWEGVKQVFSTVVEFFAGVFSNAWEAVKAVWNLAVGFFTEVGDGIRAVFEVVTQVVAGFFQEAWAAVKAVWDTAVGFFASVWAGIAKAFGGVREFFAGAFSKAWEAVTSVWNGAGAFFGGVWSQIKGVFSDVWSSFKSIGKNIVSGLKNGISGAWKSFTSWLGGKVGGLVDAVKNRLGINSPSRVFAGIGENMALGLGEGWKDEYGSIKRQIEEGMEFTALGVSASGLGGLSAAQKGPTGREGGDTYNFYSPKALDAVAAAREMKKAKQQLAMGFV